MTERRVSEYSSKSKILIPIYLSVDNSNQGRKNTVLVKDVLFCFSGLYSISCRRSETIIEYNLATFGLRP